MLSPNSFGHTYKASLVMMLLNDTVISQDYLLSFSVPVLAAIAQALSPNEIAVRISWDPLDRTFDAITNFHVEYNDTYGEAGTSILHRPQGLGVIDHILSDLSAGTIYTIQVTGKGDFSDVIAMSDIRQEKTLEFGEYL